MCSKPIAKRGPCPFHEDKNVLNYKNSNLVFAEVYSERAVNFHWRFSFFGIKFAMKDFCLNIHSFSGPQSVNIFGRERL